MRWRFGWRETAGQGGEEEEAEEEERSKVPGEENCCPDWWRGRGEQESSCDQPTSLKQCEEASEELEKAGSGEKLKKGDEGEEKEGRGEEGESWGECVEADCFHQERRSQGKGLESLWKEKIGGGVEEVDEAGEEEGGVEGGEEEDGGGGEGGGADDQGEQEGGQEEQQLGQGFPGNARTWRSREWWKTNQVPHLLSPLPPPTRSNHDHPPEPQENHGSPRQDVEQQGCLCLLLCLLQALRVQQPAGAAWQGCVCLTHNCLIVSQLNTFFPDMGESYLLLCDVV